MTGEKIPARESDQNQSEWQAELKTSTGETQPSPELSTAAKVAEIRQAINFEQIAQDTDPAGLEQATRAGVDLVYQRDVLNTELAQKQAQYAQATAFKADQDAYAQANRWRDELQKRQLRPTGMDKFKQFLHLPNRQLEKLQRQIAHFDEQDRQNSNTASLSGDIKELQTKIDQIDPTQPKTEFLAQFATPLETERKKDLLDFDALAKLSTEEYLQLWRRLNPFYVAHVTRQGIRDHISGSMVYHSDGEDEYHDGFKSILRAQKQLRPALALQKGIGQEVDPEVVASTVQAEVFDQPIDLEAIRQDPALRSVPGSSTDDKIANYLLNSYLYINGPYKSMGDTEADAAGKWADRKAIHLARNDVLNDIYGGEKGNEVFFVFPSDVIASQCQFSGADDLTETPKGYNNSSLNDLYVWPTDKALSLDAGLTFLPDQTMVDPETGSQYATKIVTQDGQEVRQVKLDPETGKKLLAENPISARNYWENYFAEHPEEKPAHIIYYDGDPSTAVHEVLEQAGILRPNGAYDHGDFTGPGDTSKRDGALLGFADNLVLNSATDVRLQKQRQALNQIAKQLIAEHYQLDIPVENHD